MIDVLNAIKSTDIAGHLSSLDWDAQDTLMKYLYKGMEQPGLYNTAVLLNWHEKVDSLTKVWKVNRSWLRLLDMEALSGLSRIDVLSDGISRR